MNCIWIVLGLLFLFVALLFQGACKLGAEADARADQAFREMIERRSQTAGGVSCEKEDANGAQTKASSAI